MSELAAFERLCESVTYECKSLGTQTDMSVKPAWTHEAYAVTVSRGSESYSTTYRQGMGHQHAPTASQVISCLLSDARSGLEHATFESFASEFGYDEDSRAAERAWTACRECSTALQAVLGEDFDRFNLAAIEAGA